jgi:tetratricopeptide (TPR) repeat protein
MNSPGLRSIALTLLLATGCNAIASIIATPAAEAAAVRPQVGKPLQAAIALANKGNGSAAMSEVRQAESVGGLTASEQAAIAQTKQFIAAKTGNFSGGGGSSTAARAKFAADYNAGRYSAVTGEDVQLLKKYGAFTGEDQIIVAQAYYLSGRAEQAVALLRSMTSGAHPSEAALKLLYSAAYKVGDNDAMRSALERLVADYNRPEYWGNLLQIAESAKGLKDQQTLDIFRLRIATGSMKRPDDYMTAAEMALEFGSSAEAANIVQKGVDAKVLSGDRVTKLLNTAKGQAAADAANYQKNLAAAQKGKTGDDLIKLGQQLVGVGRAQDAIGVIQQGIQKGPTDKDEAQVQLGLAYLGAGQKPAAINAFNAVSKQNADDAMIANLWAIYARNSR